MGADSRSCSHYHWSCCGSWSEYFGEEQKLKASLTPHRHKSISCCGFWKTNISGFSSWQPYPLQTGPWNINNVPLSQHNGICTNEYPLTAIAGCGPLDFPFIVNKVGDNYQISSSPYPELNGLLSAPVGAGDMYQRSFYSTGQPSSISSSCSSVAKVTVKLGKTFQYEISK